MADTINDIGSEYSILILTISAVLQSLLSLLDLSRVRSPLIVSLLFQVLLECLHPAGELRLALSAKEDDMRRCLDLEGDVVEPHDLREVR